MLAGVTAQVSTDPKDSFYKQVEIWEIKGVIAEQPPLRPYPLKLVEKILEEVIEGDNEKEAEIAEEYYEKIFNKAFKLKVEGIANAKIYEDDNNKQLIGLMGVDGDKQLHDLVSAGYKLDFLGAINSSNNAMPMYKLQPFYMHDAATVGPIDAYLEIDANFAVGTDKLYFQTGVNHNSFGPYYNDSCVLSPDAKHTANFSLVYNAGNWSYTQAILGLSANNFIYEDNSFEELYSQKYLAIHSINGQILEWLTASFYEVSVFGGRFEPAYLIPVPYMVSQGLTGFDDNILMGVTFSVKPMRNFIWYNDVYIDDFSVNQLVKLNFDSKIRGTLQSGIKFIPEGVDFLGPIKLDYTLVTPYMYTHKQNLISNADGSFMTGSLAVINYQQYTTGGYSIGSGLDPNSDRIQLSAEFKPIHNLNVTLKGSYIRHANVNESITTEEALNYLKADKGYFITDGSINNHQHYFEYSDKYGDNQAANAEDASPQYLPSAWDHFMFMCQDSKMYTVQAGLDVDYTLPRFSFGQISFGVSYLFEYIHNLGVNSEIFVGRDYEAGEGIPTEADVQTALDKWRSGFTDATNHYISVTGKLVW